MKKKNEKKSLSSQTPRQLESQPSEVDLPNLTSPTPRPPTPRPPTPQEARDDNPLSLGSKARFPHSQSATDELETLRQLLLGSAVEDLLNPEVISKVLPEAMTKSYQQETLTPAAVPTVESAIQASVEQDSRVLSEALFPVIGPATRKSISAAIGNLLQSLNQTLEYSLSPQSFKWRLEARRTGKSFAEVVLLRTLVYQVEQVFLIHRETGLVLQHVVADTATAQDPDLVSAMLTALQDFVKDSFAVDDEGSLNTLALGDFTLWLEEGPHAVLACVIRGTAPQSLRSVLRATQEKIHSLFNRALQTFEGDSETLNDVRPYLEDCFQAQFKDRNTGKRKTARSLSKQQLKQRKVFAWAVAGCLILILGVGAFLNRQAQQRWDAYVWQVSQQPGIVVIHEGRQKQNGIFSAISFSRPLLLDGFFRRRYVLSGLRDPLAVDPAELLKSTSINPEDVQMRWEPYFSLLPALTHQRIVTLLNPPATVSLSFDEQQVLHVAGSAPSQWVQTAKQLSTRLYGITAWEDTQLVPTDTQTLKPFKARFNPSSGGP